MTPTAECSATDPADAPSRAHQRGRYQLSWRKKLLFAALTTLLFFAVAEGSLALLGVRPVVATRDPFVGFEGRLPLFVEQPGGTEDRAARPSDRSLPHENLAHEIDAGPVLTTARGKRPWFNEQTFPRHKPDGGYRIFCVGGSTTYGRPYDDTTSFCGWLRELLSHVDPSRRWEVINAGGISYASYRVTVVMEELAAYEPDLFIIYSGHNEFLEERTYGDIRRRSPFVREVLQLLARTRTYTAISALTASRSGEDATGTAMHPGTFDQETDGRTILPAEVDTRLGHTIGPTDYERDDVLRQRVLAHFELNVERMVAIAREAGAEVMFVVPASNLPDCSPFKSRPTAGLDGPRRDQWEWLFRRAETFQQQQKWEESLALYQQAAHIDERHAEGHYRIGQCLEALGRFEEARSAFQRAADEDVCPLRAPSEVPTLLHRLAGRQHVPLVDFPTLLSDYSRREFGRPLPGRRLFLDHVHPTVTGHRLLAVALVEEMIRQRIIEPAEGTEGGLERAVAEAQRQIEKRIDPKLQGEALRNLAKVLAWAGKHQEAGRLALKALEKLPDDPESTFLAGCYLRLVDRPDEAVEFLRRALPHRADDPQAHHLLAEALAEQGQTDEALQHYFRVLELADQPADIHHRIAILLADQEQWVPAISHFQKALQRSAQENAGFERQENWSAQRRNYPTLRAPTAEIIHYNLAVVLARAGNTVEAKRHYREVLRLQPEFAEAHHNLGVLLAEEGEREQALRHYRRALELKPDYEEAERNLQSVLPCGEPSDSTPAAGDPMD